MLMRWSVRGRQLELDRPIVMGILNVTPDSFSDGGQLRSVNDAVRRAHELAEEGADIIDVGGESTRPQNAQPVSMSEELERVIPVIARVAKELPGMLVSVDTVKSDVALAALDVGAHIVNDVSGFRLDAQMPSICSAKGA